MSAIIPPSRTLFTDGFGRPAAGGYLYTYAQGTTTPKTTYQDRATTIANANPIILDADGGAFIWGTGTYTWVLKNSVQAQIWTGDTFADNYNSALVAITGGTIDGTIIGGITPAAGTFSALTITGGINNTTIGLTTPLAGKFTTMTATTATITGNETIAGTLAVTGQATVPDATADTSAVTRKQVKGLTPKTQAASTASGTTISATTGSFTAPCTGQLVIEVQGLTDTAAAISSISATSSLAGIVSQSSMRLSTTGFQYAYLPMVFGDVSTVTGTITSGAAVALSVLVRAFFQRMP